jgi:hypothetical protein
MIYHSEKEYGEILAKLGDRLFEWVKAELEDQNVHFSPYTNVDGEFYKYILIKDSSKAGYVDEVGQVTVSFDAQEIEVYDAISNEGFSIPVAELME